MKRVVTALTTEEREVLLLSAKLLTDEKIAERLGMSITKVKTLKHQVCVKARTHTRADAVRFATRHGDIGLDEVIPPEELAECLRRLDWDELSKIAQIVRESAGREFLPMIDKGVLHIPQEQHTILTGRERDVLILVGRGLTNSEIAEKLFISIGSVRNVLHKACCKLRVRSRGDALRLAFRQGEIKLSEVGSIDDLGLLLAQLKPESLGRIAQLLSKRPERECPEALALS